MAEAVTLLGVVAAGVQCAEVGVQLLLLGSKLCSRIQDAPDKVKRWLDQIQQLVALAEFMQQLDTIRDLSRLSLSSTNPAISWVEAALSDCTTQARALQDILEEMLEGVNDSSGLKMWKKILTVKREARITSALHEIERQKGLLNIWIGQSNLCQLSGLQGSADQIREGLGRVDRSTLQFSQTFAKEVQNLSTRLDDNSRLFESSFESSRNRIISNVESLREQVHEQHRKHQSESSVTHIRLNELVTTSQNSKIYLKLLANF
jgi:hypothetical protein